MACSGFLTHRFFDTQQNAMYTTNCSVLIADDVNITPKQQEQSMFILLKALAGCCGVSVNNDNVKYKANAINSEAEYVEGEDVKCDVIVVLEYIGNYKSYAKFTTTELRNVSTASSGNYIKNAVNTFINSIIYDNDTESNYTHWRVKVGSIYVHIGEGIEPVPPTPPTPPTPPEPPEPTPIVNLYNKATDTLGYRIYLDGSYPSVTADENYEVSAIIPVQSGYTYSVETECNETGGSEIIVASVNQSEYTPYGYIVDEILQSRNTTSVGTESFTVTIPANVDYVAISVKQTNTNTKFWLPA